MKSSWYPVFQRCNVPGVVQRRDRQKKKNSTTNLTSVNGACFWCLPQTSPLTLDVTTNKFFLQCSGERPKYIWNNHNNYIIPRLTLLIETFIHTYHSFTVLFSKSINTVFHFLENFLWLSWTLLFLGHFLFFWDLISLFLWAYLSYFNSWVSTPHSQLGWSQDAPAWVCRPSSLQHLCFHPPGSTFWSRFRLLPITHAQLITSCPFNPSVGQSCLHFIFPLISNYPHQYPKSHNLGFHQHPLHDTKIKPSQLALNSSPPYNQTILSSQSKHHVHNW